MFIKSSLPITERAEKSFRTERTRSPFLTTPNLSQDDREPLLRNMSRSDSSLAVNRIPPITFYRTLNLKCHFICQYIFPTIGLGDRSKKRVDVETRAGGSRPSLVASEWPFESATPLPAAGADRSFQRCELRSDPGAQSRSDVVEATVFSGGTKWVLRRRSQRGVVIAPRRSCALLHRRCQFVSAVCHLNARRLVGILRRRRKSAW